MSFLNSVLSSLNDGKPPVSVPQVRPSKPETGGSTSAPQSAKRKAEDDIPGSSSKTAKLANSRPITDSPRPILTPVSKTRVPERPKPAQQRNELPKRPEHTSNLQRASNQSNSKSAPPKVAEQTSGLPKAPPKKGTFAEILARASQNKDVAPSIGTIKHKPKEKMSLKKELALQKEALKNGKKGLPGRGMPNAQGGKTGNLPSNRAADGAKGEKADTRKTGYQGTMKPKPSTAYQGTMKPKPQVTYTGTMNPGAQPQRKKGYDSEPERATKKSAPSAPRRRYRSEEESEEEDASEDGYDYASEDYSDMDAGFDDVEEEDAEAARIARREDASEQRMLEELKRQKEERKRRAAAGKEKERSMRF